MSFSVHFDPMAISYSSASLILSVLLQKSNAAISLDFSSEVADKVCLKNESGEIVAVGDLLVSCVIADVLSNLNLSISEEAKSHWHPIFQSIQTSKDPKALLELLPHINESLTFNTFLLGNKSISVLDLQLWSSLRCNAIWNKNYKDKKDLASNVTRHFTYISSLDFVVDGILFGQTQASAAKLQQASHTKAKDQASYEINLEGAEMGKVVTRFPPEPSGYLHIGHAKAVMLNQYFAEKYKGKLIIRFDDTNPDKEEAEYEQSILEDLKFLGIHGDFLSHTSDYFPVIRDYAIQLIKEGKAYCDDTSSEIMRDERSKGIESKCRANSVEENLKRFEEMEKATEFGQKNCVRAKMGMHHLNKALRDPVMYRCNQTPHHITGDKYRIYPTYDFACPIVDSIEGVTHALRTTEYHDRNDQYYWFIEALGLRKPFIYDYSRLNFTYTLLSKRKLNWFVKNEKVSGWNDPRFPTVRGIIRRGLSVDALKEYILMQGPSKNIVLLEWDKLWSVNKKIIDPISPRYTALLTEEPVCKVCILDGPSTAEQRHVLKHKKNESLGFKQVWYSNEILLEQADVSDMQEGEEFTLMDWGNAIVKKITNRSADGKILGMNVVLNLDGDFKKTKKKLTWISNIPSNASLQLALHNYGFLITKKKLEEEDSFEDYLNESSETIQNAIGDYNLSGVKVGDFIQLERKGFYICDSIENDLIHLILVPDGKTKLPGQV